MTKIVYPLTYATIGVEALVLTVSLPDGQLPQLTDNALGELRDIEFIEWDMTGSSVRATIDIVVVPYMDALERLENLEGLKVQLVQSQSVGYDGVAELLPEGMVFANATSVHETSTAEMALALVLASQRGIPDFVRASCDGHWSRSWRQSLADRNVLLVGYGGVGRAIEKRILPFETHVVRVARTQRSNEGEIVHGLNELPDLLRVADVVIVCVPLNDSTVHLVNDAFLTSMHDDALLVNVSRGRIADTEALVAHASKGRLRLALDVTEPEPLPDGHPLFSLPNVLISPHVGGATSAMLPRMARLLRNQIERMTRGEDPLNVVIRT